MVQVSKRLVVKREIPVDNSKDLVNSLDVALAEIGKPAIFATCIIKFSFFFRKKFAF